MHSGAMSMITLRSLPAIWCMPSPPLRHSADSTRLENLMQQAVGPRWLETDWTLVDMQTVCAACLGPGEHASMNLNLGPFSSLLHFVQHWRGKRIQSCRPLDRGGSRLARSRQTRRQAVRQLPGSFSAASSRPPTMRAFTWPPMAGGLTGVTPAKTPPLAHRSTPLAPFVACLGSSCSTVKPHVQVLQGSMACSCAPCSCRGRCHGKLSTRQDLRPEAGHTHRPATATCGTRCHTCRPRTLSPLLQQVLTRLRRRVRPGLARWTAASQEGQGQAVKWPQSGLLCRWGACATLSCPEKGLHV